MTPARPTIIARRRGYGFQAALIALSSAVPMTAAFVLRLSGDAFRVWVGFAWMIGVFLTAFFCGYLQGLSVIAIVYFVTPVLFGRGPDTRPETVDRVLALAGLSLVVSWTAATRRHGEQALARANDDLEERVAVRTSELAATRDWLEKTLASIGDAVIAANADGKITFMNGMAESLTGWKAGETIGKPIAEVFRIVNEETRAPLENPLDRALRAARVQGLANHTILISRDGQEIAIDDSAAPIFDDSSRVTGAVLVFRDISARRSAERERERMLAEARDARDAAERRRFQIHSLFMQSPVIINIHRGADHIFELVHPGMSVLLAGGDAAGIPARKAIADPWRAVYTHGLNRAFESGVPSFAHEIRAESGSRESFYSFIHHPWQGLDGAIAGVMTLVFDVTDQVSARREMQIVNARLTQAAKLESLGVLAGGVAHDFNNLLVGIMGNASLAQDMFEPDHPAHGLAANVVKASESAALLTRQMLAYSGRGKFVIEPVDISRSIREWLPLIASAISKSVAFDADLPPGLPAIVADRGQIQAVVMNLVINAAEAYGEGSGMVRISTSLRQVRGGETHPVAGLPPLEPGPYICLEVSDNGSGMSEEVSARIFDPFFTTKFTGRGLGLSAVLGVVRAHSGAIELESEPGRGATFRVWLPASAESVAGAVGDAAPDLSGVGTILLVDDEETVRRTAAAALESYGATVLLAYDGVSAIDTFIRHRDDISLVILDLTMPILNGEAVLGRLRGIDPGVKVILSSGFSAEEATKRIDPARISGFLQKPYSGRAIAAAVRNAFRGAGTIGEPPKGTSAQAV